MAYAALNSVAPELVQKEFKACEGYYHLPLVYLFIVDAKKELKHHLPPSPPKTGLSKVFSVLKGGPVLMTEVVDGELAVQYMRAS